MGYPNRDIHCAGLFSPGSVSRMSVLESMTQGARFAALRDLNFGFGGWTMQGLIFARRNDRRRDPLWVYPQDSGHHSNELALPRLTVL